MRKILLKKGKLFLMRELTLRDVEKSHNLLNLVAEEMKGKGKEEYIISKSKDKIAAIIDDDNNKMVGIFLLDEKRKEKHICLCGSTYRKSDKAKHERTQKHQDYLKQQVANKEE
jgi:hypothetical protein